MAGRPLDRGCNSSCLTTRCFGSSPSECCNFFKSGICVTSCGERSKPDPKGNCVYANDWAGADCQEYDCGKNCFFANSTANPGEFPWQATLCSPLHGQFCSGVVVGCSCVLTAAHCVVQDRVSISNLTVCVGQHCGGCSQNDPQGRFRCFKPLSITPHHNFIPFTLNDIAIIKLRNPVLCSSNHTMPIYLPNKTQDGPGSNSEPISSFVTVWEKINLNDNRSECLRKTEVRLLTSSRGCEREHLTYRIKDRLISNNEVCTGDSGGPLVFKRMDDEDHYVLAGIVSWMRGCGTVRETGVYTSLLAHLDWVEQTCKNNSY